MLRIAGNAPTSPYGRGEGRRSCRPKSRTRIPARCGTPRSTP